MMKRAIGYIRISTKDQSNFSLSGQEKYITEHCVKQEIELLTIFKDDGQSAKNFDRPDWQKLEAFIKQNHSSVDYLIVSKYDRFSRNVSEALQMIDKLENKYNIRIISVMEPIALHPSSPYFFQFRTQMLVGANVELLVIKDRTKFGIHQANKDGRWINNAPTGYKNARDEKNKSILVIDEIKAPFVRQAFQLFLAGMPIAEIKRALLRKGFKVQGNSFYQRMFANPVYAGMITVPAYYDEPEKLVKGIHEPLITESTYWQALAILKGHGTRSHLEFNEAVPLRGALRNSQFQLMTAGNSKGKTKYYWYYVDPANRKHYNAKKLHGQFNGILQELSFSRNQIHHLQGKAAQLLKSSLKDREAEVQANDLQLNALAKKIDNLEEKYIVDGLDKTTYQKWKHRFLDERASLTARSQELRKPLAAVWDSFNTNLQKLSDLNYFFSNSHIHQKHAFIRLVFDNKLYYEQDIYRTPYLLHIFSSKAMSLKEKRLLEVVQPDLEFRSLVVSSPYGNRTRLSSVKGRCPSR